MTGPTQTFPLPGANAVEMDLHPNATVATLEAGGRDPGPLPERFETDRLVLQRPYGVDVDRLHALFSDLADPDDVFARCGWERHEDPGDTREYLRDRADRWERAAFFEYVIESTDAGEYAGTACIERSGDDGAVEFGCWLRKPFWGREYSGETTEVLVHAAFEFLAAPYVVAGCLASNDRSRRAIEKFVRRFGGDYYGTVPTVPSGEDDATAGHHEWVITRAAFEAGESGLSTTVPGVEYDDLEF